MANCASMPGRGRSSAGREIAAAGSNRQHSQATLPLPRSVISNSGDEENLSEAPASEVPVGQPGLRLDKWLWHARFCRTRVLAAELAAAGKVRIAGAVISKAHYAVKPGDVLTFPLGPHIR